MERNQHGKNYINGLNIKNMKKTFFFVLFIFIILSSQSCYVGMSYEKNFTSLNGVESKDCVENIQDVTLLFESEKIDFLYEKIGLIEIKSSQYQQNDSELLKELKKIAIDNCCDAVINIKREYSKRESGILFSKEELEKYDAKVYVGIGVKKIKND